MDGTGTATLDEAWREAEAAREGWSVGRLERTAPAYPAEWWAYARKSGGPNRNFDEIAGPGAPTPAAALLALAQRLRESR